MKAEKKYSKYEVVDMIIAEKNEYRKKADWYWLQMVKIENKAEDVGWDEELYNDYKDMNDERLKINYTVLSLEELAQKIMKGGK